MADSASAATAREAAYEFRAAAISAGTWVAESPYPQDPASTANSYAEALRAVAVAFDALADAVNVSDHASALSDPLAAVLDALSAGLPVLFDSDPDTKLATLVAAAGAFRALAESFNSLPALEAETNSTYPAARGRAEALVVAHAIEIAADAVRSYLAALDASDFDTVDVDPLVEAASDAEGAAIFVVCDCAEALASAHRSRSEHLDQSNGEQD